MRRRPSSLAPEEAAVRFAWWVAFIATLTLIAVLGLVKSAQALTISPAAATTTLGMPLGEKAEGEAEGSEDEGFEVEECENAEECEEDEVGSAVPQECLLSGAEATVHASASKDMVRLQVRYTTSVPTAVAIEYGLHGRKGPLYLGGERKRIAREGVLRLTRSLTEAQMAKVMAAESFAVRLRVPAAPGYCKAFFHHQLDRKRATPSGLAWRQSE